MARRVPVLIAVLIAIAFCYFLFRGRDAVEPVHGSARIETAQAISASHSETTSEPVRVGSERESAAFPLAEAESGSVLAVLVVAKEDRRPLADIRLTVFLKDPKPGSSSRDVDGNRGTIETGPRTDSEGRAEFDLPTGIALTISARAEDWTTGSAYLEVPALDLGARRELTIELLTGNDVVFHGQVLGREDRRPLAMATGYVESPGGGVRFRDGKVESGSSSAHRLDFTADAEGRFELELAAWKAPWATISAPGFAAALFAPTSGHETRESAQPIYLDRAAALKIHLIDAKGPPLSEARVRAGTESYHIQQPEGASLSVMTSIPDPTWAADTDAEGRCTLSALPPGAPLRVEAWRGAKSLRREAEPITLRPGEVREIEWPIGGGCRLSGRVTDSKSAPVVSQELWVLGAQMDKPEYLVTYAGERIIARAKTDGEGRYHVDDLHAGRVLVGPAPSRAYIGPAREDAIAPLAVVVEIPEGAREVERDLVLHRGLYIRGHVFDPAGAPVFRAAVMGFTENGVMHSGTQGTDDGSFALGPLVPGVFQLRAMGMGKYATSDTVTASAGDEGVELRLVSAGALVGAIVDAKTGRSCRAQIAVSWREPSTPFLMLGSTQEDGSFKFEGLRAGAYDLSASTEDRKSGSLRGVAVAAGAASAGLVVRVSPGARVTVRYQGKTQWGNFELESDGVVLGGDGLQTGTSSTRVVPPGHVITRFRLHNPDRVQEKAFDLAVGEEKEAVFGEID